MGNAIAALGWTPKVFWDASLVEYFAAIEGYNNFQRQKSGDPEPLTTEEYEELLAMQKAAKSKKK